MDELRRLALDHAVTIATLVKTDRIDADEVVSAAKKFHAFLTGENADVMRIPNAKPPPIPQQTANYDLGRSEQSQLVVLGGIGPMPRFDATCGPIGSGGSPDLLERDAADIPTRLVRRGDPPPDAA